MRRQMTDYYQLPVVVPEKIYPHAVAIIFCATEFQVGAEYLT